MRLYTQVVMIENQHDAFEAIECYVRERLAARHDVYGWAPIEDDTGKQALVLIAHDASARSFPRSINGISLVLRRIGAPEPQMK